HNVNSGGKLTSTTQSPSQLQAMVQEIPATAADIEMMTQGLSAYLILFYMGLVAAFLNVPVIYVLLRSPKLRADSKLLVSLSLGGMINCIALCIMGNFRYHLYLEALKSYMVPVETPRTCAMRMQMWLRLVGNVWPPTVTLLMGVERILACWAPVFYLAHLSKNKPTENVKFDCGRKATFGDVFATLLYVNEIFGYVVGLILNMAAYLHTRSIIQSENVRDQVKRLRYYVAVAAISTLLVAVPDIKQILIGLLKGAGLDEWISQSFNWLGLIASSFNLFVYLTLSQEFRVEFVKYLCIFKNRKGNHISRTVIAVPMKHTVHMKAVTD
ncbi:hypothetical protein GCK32_010467, partial [Trichostrongylus colubriformis]